MIRTPVRDHGLVDIEHQLSGVVEPSVGQYDSKQGQYPLHHNLVCPKRQHPIAHTASGTVSLPGERYNGTSPSGESLAHLQLRGFGHHAFPSTVGSESGPEVVRSIHFLLFYGVIDDLWLHRQACMSWWWPCPATCI